MGGGALPPPRTLRVRRDDPPPRVAAGTARRARAAARTGLKLWADQDGGTFGRVPDDLRERAESLGIWPGDVAGGPDDRPDDDGGLAGVREPRRPGPGGPGGPGHLAAEADLRYERLG